MNRWNDALQLEFSWIKFEENVEDGGFRWTKPFVGTISLHALFDVRSCVLNGTLLLDVSVTSVNDLVELIVEDMFDKHLLTYGQKLKVCLRLITADDLVRFIITVDKQNVTIEVSFIF